MKISYVMPVFNGSAFIAESLESIWSQSHEDFEIIVIDDGSTDDIDPLKKYYDKVKWLNLPRRAGGAVCRNLGNQNASGDIIAVCDAGDFYERIRGESLEKMFSEESEIDVAYSHVQVVYPGVQQSYIQEAKSWDGNSKPPISHPTVAYRARVADQVRYHEGCLDTDFYEFFLIDAFRKGFKFDFIPKVLTFKMDLSGSGNYRDYKKAKEEKAKKYEEYGIEIERELV